MVVFGFILIGSYAAGLLLERFGGGVTVVVATVVMVGLSLVTTSIPTYVTRRPLQRPSLSELERRLLYPCARSEPAIS